MLDDAFLFFTLDTLFVIHDSNVSVKSVCVSVPLPPPEAPYEPNIPRSIPADALTFQLVFDVFEEFVTFDKLFETASISSVSAELESATATCFPVSSNTICE
jgi:hypothetical protein